MPDDHKQPPKTVAEIGIHIGYIRDDLKEIKDTIKDSPTRSEFDSLSTHVDDISKTVEDKVSRKEVGVIGSIIGLVLGFLTFIFNYLR